jgi:imidazole glycerol-phosphate synthase subunit HisF
MFRPRIIPVLLLRAGGLVKSQRFGDFRYIGDPINAVKIFNDFRADELIFLDIMATAANQTISADFVRSVGEEANMPFAAGGGIRTLQHIRDIVGAGAEKVVIGSEAAENPGFVADAATHFGSSTIVVCIDVKRARLSGEARVCTVNGTRRTRYEPAEFAMLMEEKGAGEVIVQAIDADGGMDGYDIDLIRSVSERVSIPVVALGGAGNLSHLKDAYEAGRATGLGAGSIFVFHGRKKGVLINYPERSERPF